MPGRRQLSLANESSNRKVTLLEAAGAGPWDKLQRVRGEWAQTPLVHRRSNGKGRGGMERADVLRWEKVPNLHETKITQGRGGNCRCRKLNSLLQQNQVLSLPAVISEDH